MISHGIALSFPTSRMPSSKPTVARFVPLLPLDQAVTFCSRPLRAAVLIFLFSLLEVHQAGIILPCRHVRFDDRIVLSHLNQVSRGVSGHLKSSHRTHLARSTVEVGRCPTFLLGLRLRQRDLVGLLDGALDHLLLLGRECGGELAVELGLRFGEGWKNIVSRWNQKVNV